MMKKLLTAGVIALGCVAGTAEAATTITFLAGGSGVPTGLGDYGTIQNFDSLAVGTSIGTNAAVFNSTVPGVAGRPSGATQNFGAVYASGSGYSVSFTPTNSFSFVLGSLDAYNTLTLTYADNSVTALTGTNIIGGLGVAGAEGRVTYTVTSGPKIIGAQFTTTAAAFEFDTLSEALPEPAAWGMMILGFGMVGGVLRRRTSAKIQFA